MTKELRLIAEQDREIKALRGEIRRLSHLLLQAPHRVWFVQESHYDYQQVVYVASSKEHAESWIEERKRSNARIPNWPYKYRPEVWAEEMTVDGDEDRHITAP